jgi:hypothetical protein
MAEASGMSLGKCMGEWLTDTAEGAQFVSVKMQEARKAPKTVMREMQAAVHGLAESLNEQAEEMRRRERQGRAAAVSGAAPAALPPSSNTGGKVPRENPKPRGVKSVVPDVPYSGLDASGRRVSLAGGEYFDKAGLLQRVKK